MNRPSSPPRRGSGETVMTIIIVLGALAAAVVVCAWIEPS